MPDDVSMLVSAINSLTDDKKTPFDDGAGFPELMSRGSLGKRRT